MEIVRVRVSEATFVGDKYMHQTKVASRRSQRNLILANTHRRTEKDPHTTYNTHNTQHTTHTQAQTNRRPHPPDASHMTTTTVQPPATFFRTQTLTPRLVAVQRLRGISQQGEISTATATAIAAAWPSSPQKRARPPWLRRIGDRQDGLALLRTG